MELYRAKERLALAEAVIGLIKIIQAGRFKNKGGPYRANGVEAILLSSAVLISHVNGKPKGASGIGRLLGIPRSTAQRKLNELEAKGIVLRRRNVYYICDIRKNEDAYIDKGMSLIRRCAKV